MEEEKMIVIDLRLSTGGVTILVGVLIVMMLLISSSLAEGRAVVATGRVSVTQSNGMRQFYLGGPGYFGGVAKTACASGYHMASLWEIADPSNLKYNTNLGVQQTDSGEGPPADESYFRGWVRTGYASNGSTTVGHANCFNWDTSNPSWYGTTAALPSLWTSSQQDIGIWDLGYAECGTILFVWCIED
jgi:hypothetical protein